MLFASSCTSQPASSLSVLTFFFCQCRVPHSRGPRLRLHAAPIFTHHHLVAKYETSPRCCLPYIGTGVLLTAPTPHRKVMLQVAEVVPLARRTVTIPDPTNWAWVVERLTPQLLLDHVPQDTGSGVSWTASSKKLTSMGHPESSARPGGGRKLLRGSDIPVNGPIPCPNTHVWGLS